MAKEDGGRLYLSEAAFADELRRHREASGISQSELAAKVRGHGLDYFSQTTVSRIEKGTRPPRIAEGEAIARVFGVGLEQLLAGDARYLAVNRAIWAAGSITRRIDQLQDEVGQLGGLILTVREAVELIDSGVPGPPGSHTEAVIENSIAVLREIASTDLRAIFDEITGDDL